MSYKYIDMETYERKGQFKYFRGLAYPYLGVTVNVDITDFMNEAKEKDLPFFLTLCYCVAQAANAVPEFRQRIKDGRIVQYDWCQTSHTESLDGGSYCYCTLKSDMSFKDYLPQAMLAQESAKLMGSLEDGDDVDSLLFISSAPWMSYTALIQPVPDPADSNPRITWGKYFMDGERVMLPISVLCNHALVDALHISRFYDMLDMVLSSMFR